jgi:hypothetical protein
VFTVNNYSEEIVQKILDFAHSNFKTEIKKVIIGKETAPTTGTPHLQGFIQFITKKRFWNLKSLWGDTVHWEPARGSEQKNLEYCSKGGDLLVSMGFKNEAVHAAIKTNYKGQEYWEMIVKDAYSLGPEEFAQKWPREWLLRRGAVERLMLDASKRTMRVWNGNLQLKNIWVWGAPGIGKSQWAHRQATGGQTLFKNLNRWWDGMDVREVTKVLIEDFPSPAYDGMAHLLKIWGDRYTFTGEIKNSAIAIDPGRFFLIVTSNFHPGSCFNKEEDKEAIQRRFAVIEMREDNSEWVRRIQLNPVILSRNESGEEEEEEEQEQEPVTMEEALLSLRKEPTAEMEPGRVNWEDGEVEKQDSQGKWHWIKGKGFVKNGDE